MGKQVDGITVIYVIGAGIARELKNGSVLETTVAYLPPPGLLF